MRFACAEEQRPTWGLLHGVDAGVMVGEELEVVSESGVMRGRADRTGEVRRLGQLLAPLPVAPAPPAVIAAGLNYKGHAEETGKALPRFPITIWVNPASVPARPDEDIFVPKIAQNPLEIDYEVELAIVIGSAEDGGFCRNVSEADAMKFVAGFTVANDVSARRWQGKKGGGQWCRAKSFDTFTPVGPSLLLTGDDLDYDTGNFGFPLWSKVNGKTMQSSNTSDMIFSPAELVSFASQGTTLLPGTILLTGTPQGVGYTQSPPVFLEHGDFVEVAIEGIGSLRNKVVFE